MSKAILNTAAEARYRLLLLLSVLPKAEYSHLCNKGAHRPGILIMDSPIQAMKDKDGIELSKGLFEYITNNSACGQVIIIDNRLPDNANLKKANIPDFLSRC